MCRFDLLAKPVLAIGIDHAPFQPRAKTSTIQVLACFKLKQNFSVCPPEKHDLPHPKVGTRSMHLIMQRGNIYKTPCIPKKLINFSFKIFDYIKVCIYEYSCRIVSQSWRLDKSQVQLCLQKLSRRCMW